MARTDLEQLVWQMSADIRTLEKQNAKALANVRGTADKIEGRYKSLAKVDVGKFLDQTFDRSRLAAFDAGSARIPIFGQALQALGPAGLTAAGGVGAVALAVTQAIGAMRFADELDDMGQKLNVTTDYLQEMRFALTEVGGEAKDADSAIEGFQKKLGEGMAGGKAKKWFERLGFGGEDLKAFGSTEVAMSAVLDKISKLGTEAERAAVAEKLGLGPMVALAREGAGKLEELRQKARDLGVVMDADLVKKGADANQQFETMSKVIDINLKSAFVDLGPAIVNVMGFVAMLARNINDVADSWHKLEDRSRTTLTRLDSRLAVEQKEMVDRFGPPSRMNPVMRFNFNDINRRRQRIAEELVSRPSTAPAGDTPGADLIDVSTSSGGRGASGPSASELADRRAQLERTLAIEIARLTNNHDLVRSLELQNDLAARIKAYDDAGLSKAEATLKATQDQLRLQDAQEAAADRSLKAAQRTVGIERERLLGNEAMAAFLERRGELEEAINSLSAMGLDLVTATNLAMRDQRDIEEARVIAQARILADAAAEHQLTLARLNGDRERTRELERADAIRRRGREIEANNRWNFGDGDVEATVQVDQEIAAQSRAGFRDGVRGMLDDLQSGGLEGVLSGIFGRVSDRLMDDVADILTDVLRGPGKGKSGGGLLDSFGSWITGKIPGFAAGTDNAPAGMAYVHKGEVLTNLAGGTRVIPAAQVSQALRVPAASGRFGGGQSFTFAPTVHAPGATAEAVARLGEIMEQQRRDFARNVRATVNRDMATGRVGVPSWS